MPPNASLPRRPRVHAAVAAAALTLLLAGCSVPGSPPSGSGSPAASIPPAASSTATGAPVSTPTATPIGGATETTDPLAGLTLEQRVGQLFMVGTKALAPQSG